MAEFMCLWRCYAQALRSLCEWMSSAPYTVQWKPRKKANVCHIVLVLERRLRQHAHVQMLKEKQCFHILWAVYALGLWELMSLYFVSRRDRDNQCCVWALGTHVLLKKTVACLIRHSDSFQYCPLLLRAFGLVSQWAKAPLWGLGEP